ncbi:hypothetical protein OG479_13090 [Streptomyces subrutilus]|nr:hypothetical protein [Streptomyces subrutilus]WSJ30164.1 hypothetical protein OG479_13090 [Streptomyces subrutilus]
MATREVPMAVITTARITAAAAISPPVRAGPVRTAPSWPPGAGAERDAYAAGLKTVLLRYLEPMVTTHRPR